MFVIVLRDTVNNRTKTLDFLIYDTAEEAANLCHQRNTIPGLTHDIRYEFREVTP